LKKKTIPAFCFLLLIVGLVLTGCVSSRPTVPKVLSLQENSALLLPDDTQSDPGGKSGYTFMLSATKTDNPNEYSRREIENFLCALVENFITVADVSKNDLYGRYYVKARENTALEKQKMANSEICKWFEDRVSVTARGNMNIIDTHAITMFYQQVNRIIGQEKFIYTPGLKAANIVIEFEKQNTTTTITSLMGETSALLDNLRVRIGIKNSKVGLEMYTMGDDSLIIDSQQIKFTPEELEFRKTNRLVKVNLGMELDPYVRHFSLVHELFHTLGFSGHSPYHDSYLFPFAVPPYSGPLPGLRATNIILTPIAQRIVEMLYRPEILPAMTLPHAAQIVQNLKLLHITPTSEIITTLKKMAGELETEKKQLLTKAKENFDRRMSIYLLQDRLNMKELALLRELEEIKRDYKLPADIIQLVTNAKFQYEKIAHILRELKIHKDNKKRLTEAPSEVDIKKKAKKLELLKMAQIQIVVLNDLLALQKEISAAEQKLQATHSTEEMEGLEEELRHIQRQLITIKKELEGVYNILCKFIFTIFQI